MAKLSSLPTNSSPGTSDSIVMVQATGPTDVQVAVSKLLAVVYPVGCIYTEISGVNPAVTFGFGTWLAFGGGRVLIGNGTSDQAFAAGATGGESTHILLTGEMPSHTHSSGALDFLYSDGTTTDAAGSGKFSSSAHSNTTIATGGDGAHNNLQPYIVVYFWRRTA